MADKFLLRVQAQREHERAAQVLAAPGTVLNGYEEGAWATKAGRDSDMPNEMQPLRPIERDGKRYCPAEGATKDALCERELRADNTRGVCAKCLKKPGMRSRQAGFFQAPIGSTATNREEPTPEPRTSTESRVKKRTQQAAKGVRKQFEALATALELDPEDLLTAFMEDWIKTTKTRALREKTDGKDDDLLGAMGRRSGIDDDDDDDTGPGGYSGRRP
jgi:hypothetical protein